MVDKTVHVVGAGISGMGAAHLLARRGHTPVVLEASERVGGRAGYRREHGLCLEVGGKNFSSGHPIINGLVSEFGLDASDVQHPSFHVVMDGRLVSFDKKRTLSGDLGVVGALGVQGAFEFKRLMDSAFEQAPQLNHVSGLIESIERQFDGQPVSAQFARRLVDGPLRMFSIIAGGAEPSEMAYSSLLLFLAGFRAGSHHSIRGGMGALFDGLQRGKTVRHGVEIRKVIVADGRVRGLRVREGGVERVIDTDRVVLALPLHLLPGLLDLPPAVEAAARQVRYFPVAMANAVYDRDVFDEKVSSVMFDPASRIGHCSANRLYQKNMVRYTLSGQRAREVLHRPDEELLAIAESDFRRVRPIPGKLEHVNVTRHLGGLCAYAPNYSRLRRTLVRHFEGIEGLAVAGDFLHGHHMEGCLQSAHEAVERLLRDPHDATRSPRAGLPAALAA